MIDRLRQWLFGPEIAVFHRFHAPPYGGGNQFLMAVVKQLRGSGVDIGEASKATKRTKACLFNSHTFDESGLASLASRRCRNVHRIDGPIGIYRATDNEVDRRIWEVNQSYADATILQSRYSLQAHESIGLTYRDPVVIPNAVDPAIFHPGPPVAWDTSRKTRLISTSWSDNPNKGASIYRWIEDNLDWNRYEYTFVGRSPVRFDRIRSLPPLSSEALAAELRAHDVYITASRNDACSNALIEALACGLPSLALRSGGNPELVGQGGAFFEGTEDVLEQLKELVNNYEDRRSRIRVAPLSEVADRYLAVLRGSSPDRLAPAASSDSQFAPR